MPACTPSHTSCLRMMLATQAVSRAFPADSYLLRLKKVPAPSQFTVIWPDFQDLPGEDPLFHCLRPSSAKVRQTVFSLLACDSIILCRVLLFRVQHRAIARTYEMIHALSRPSQG